MWNLHLFCVCYKHSKAYNTLYTKVDKPRGKLYGLFKSLSQRKSWFIFWWMKFFSRCFSRLFFFFILQFFFFTICIIIFASRKFQLRRMVYLFEKISRPKGMNEKTLKVSVKLFLFEQDYLILSFFFF